MNPPGGQPTLSMNDLTCENTTWDSNVSWVVLTHCTVCHSVDLGPGMRGQLTVKPLWASILTPKMMSWRYGENRRGRHGRWTQWRWSHHAQRLQPGCRPAGDSFEMAGVQSKVEPAESQLSRRYCAERACPTSPSMRPMAIASLTGPCAWSESSIRIHVRIRTKLKTDNPPV